MANSESQGAADTHRAEQLRELFDAAMERLPTERGDFLSAECGEDVELRRELEELLRCADDGGFLKPPDGGPLLSLELDGPDPLIGQTIGAYAIQSVIARGGMGAVYLAEQDNPRRPVAVKIMQVGLWSGSAKRRFEYESHILGRLQHPNIAQVYEAGTAKLDGGASRDVSFFAMEYVPGGLPITEYADRNKLGVRERLELFLQVCDGVHYGHQRGVIHRDLKPGNILVGDDAGGPSGIIVGEFLR